MRVSAIAITTVFFSLALVFMGAHAGDEKKSLKPTQRWAGKVADGEMKKAAPRTGYLTTQDAFEKLWDAWELKNKAPTIDFKKQMVFVQITSGPNNISTSYTLDAKGNLTAQSEQTLIAGPGFGYGIDVLDRQGIKSYLGKLIE